MPAEPRGPLEPQILSLLADGQPRSIADLATLLGADSFGLRHVLGRLKDQRRIVQVGVRYEEPGAGGGWQRGKHVHQAVWTLPAGT